MDASALDEPFPTPGIFRALTAKTQEKVIRVGAGTDPGALAGAINRALMDAPTVKLRAFGAPAIAKMVRASVYARTFIAERAEDLVVRIGLEEVSLVDNENPEGPLVKTNATIFICSLASR